MGSDIKIKNRFTVYEFKQDPVFIIDGVRPIILKTSFELMCFKAAVKRVGQKNYFPLTGERFDPFRQIFMGFNEMSGGINPGNRHYFSSSAMERIGFNFR